MKRLDPCCNHPEHATPWENENGWVLTGIASKSDTWEAWMPDEWEAHCSRSSYEASEGRRNQPSKRYRRKDAA